MVKYSLKHKKKKKHEKKEKKKTHVKLDLR